MPQPFSQNFPSLPLEILELIVGYHGEPVERPGHGPYWFGWSPTLLALHLTSRELRACALREMGKNCAICFGDPAKSNEKLRQLLLSSTPLPRLGGIAQYIKSLAIGIWDIDPSNISTTTQTSNFFDFPLLEYFCDRVALQEVHLVGGHYREGESDSNHRPPSLDWNELPPDVVQKFQLLIRKPALTTLSFVALQNLPQDLFQGITSEEVRLTKCTFANPAPGLPKSINDSIRDLDIDESDIPTNVSLPNLKSISGTDLVLEPFNTMWTLIRESQSTLENLEIYDRFEDSHSFPPTFQLSDLPTLEVFAYGHDHRRTDPEHAPAIIPQLDFLRGDGVVGLQELELGFNQCYWVSVEDALMRAKDPVWDTVDILLTSARFEELHGVILSFDIPVITDLEPFLIPDDPNVWAEVQKISDETNERLESAFCASFPRLLESSINLEVQVETHVIDIFKDMMNNHRDATESDSEDGLL